MALFPEIHTLADLVRLHARQRPQQTALWFRGHETTYGDLDADASRIANGLIATGVIPQTRIAYLGKNSDHYFELLFGAAKARAVLVAVNWRLASAEIEYVLHDSETALLFVEDEFRQAAEAMRSRLPALQRVIALGAESNDEFTTWRDAQPPTDPNLPVNGDDAIVQMYSSGTTGRPKGVEIMHRSFPALRRAEHAIGGWATLTSDDVSIIVMPTFHMLGTGLAITALYNGATCVILKQADARETLEAIPRLKVTMLTAAPAFLGLLLQEETCRRTDFSSLKVITYAGSPINPTLLAEAVRVFGCDFVQYYGTTESVGEVTVLAPEDHRRGDEQLLQSCGKPIPGVTVRIVDGQGRDLDTGKTGEFWVQTPAIMKSYWKLPEATAETLRDGWYRTGDVGYRDEQGYYYIVDRLKDMIVTGGENVYSAEVEAVVAAHPAVREVAVIGVPDPKWGEAVKAIIVKKPDAEATAADIIAFARERIAAYKAPKSVDFTDIPLPRTPSGKVLKRELRGPYWVNQARRVS